MDVGGKVSGGFLPTFDERAAPLSHASIQNGGDGCGDEREQEEPPVHGDHREGAHEDRGARGDDLGGHVRDDGLHGADVVENPRLDFPRAGRGKKGQSHALEVGEHSHAKVVHDRLPHSYGEERLEHAENRARSVNGDHAERAPREKSDVAFGQGNIDDLAHEKRREHSRESTKRDEREHECEGRPVRGKERENASGLDLLAVVEPRIGKLERPHAERMSLCCAACASGRRVTRSRFTWCGSFTEYAMTSATSSAVSGFSTPS